MPIKVLARANNAAEILIYDPIGQDWYGNGVTAKRFRDDLAALGNVTDITVRINSPGGEVFDGFSIYNALKQHAAKVTVHVDGLAASIASVIAMAGDEVFMGEGAMFMVHSPWTIAMGDADNMREVADMLDKIEVGLVDAYVAHTQQDRKTVEKWMAVETWFTRQEAIDAGLATGVSDPKAAPAAASFNPLKSAASAQFRAFASTRVSKPLQTAADPQQSAAADAPTENTRMTPEEMAALAAAEQTKAEAIRAKAIADESARRDAIQARFGRFAAQFPELLQACQRDTACTVDAAGIKLLAKLGEDSAPLNPAPHVSAGVDSRDKFIAGVSNAIMARRGLEKIEGGNEFAGAGLQRICRAVLTRAGVAHADRLEGAALASKVFATMTTSDFPLLLSNTANKSLRAAYEAAPSTWQLWAKKGEVSDFKANSRLQVGSFNSLAVIPEGSEYKAASHSEESESIQAQTKGRFISLTRQMIINDDLGAFVDRASRLGFAARRTVNEDVYAKLAANPTMSDTGALFNATAVTTAGGHANLAGSGAAITVAAIAAGEAAIAVQKDKDLRTTLNLTPRFILVPRGKKVVAWEVLNSPTDISSANSNKKNYAASLALEIVSDAELDKASATAWYLASDPMVEALIEVAFLNGQDTPYTEEDVDFMTDAVLLKARLDYGVGAMGWRGAWKNPGA